MQTRHILLAGAFYIGSQFVSFGLDFLRPIHEFGSSTLDERPTIRGEAFQDFDADQMVIVFQFSEVLQSTAIDASNAITKRVQAVSDYLESEGLKHKRSTVSLNQGRLYAGEKVAREYYGSQTIDVVFTDFAAMPRHVQAILDRGASGILKTIAKLNNRYNAERLVRRLAIEDAHRRAQDLAQDLGFAKARFLGLPSGSYGYGSGSFRSGAGGVSSYDPIEADIKSIIGEMDEIAIAEPQPTEAIRLPYLEAPKVRVSESVELKFEFLTVQVPGNNVSNPQQSQIH